MLPLGMSYGSALPKNAVDEVEVEHTRNVLIRTFRLLPSSSDLGLGLERNSKLHT